MKPASKDAHASFASFDEWDNHVETIKKMNLEEYMSIKEDAGCFSYSVMR